MKYLFSFVLAVVLMASSSLALSAQGGFDGPGAAHGGGFQGPTAGAPADTVARALDSRDDAFVVLTGNIVQRYAGSDDMYLFRDATGEMMVEIDHEVFAGRTVTPESRVRLSGKVDRDGPSEPVTVDVKVIEIL